MNTKKTLLLLIALIVLINYRNYFMPDFSKLSQNITLLKSKIDREKRLNAMKILPKNLDIKEKTLFFNAKQDSYSKSMGKLQQIVTDAASGLCKVRNIKWAQTAMDEKTYEVLSIDTSLKCSPKKLMKFVNKLRSGNKLITIHNLVIIHFPKKEVLNVSLQIHGYRIKNAH